MSANELCLVCGEGHVTKHIDQIQSVYKGTTGSVPMHYKTCNACGSDFATAEESRLNKRAVLAFRKSVDGLLSGLEIAALRERYCISQKQAAKLFGGGPVAFSKYENDDVAHSEAMDKLLRLVLESDQVFEMLVQQKGMTSELPANVPVQESVRKPFKIGTFHSAVKINLRAGDRRPMKMTAVHSYKSANEQNEELGCTL